MKALRPILALGLYFSIVPVASVAQLAEATTELTVDQVLAEADKHDKADSVTVKGTVVEFVQKTSRLGHPYFTFKLKGDKGEVNVYSRGKADEKVKDKAKVVVTGKFRKSKQVADFTVKNEIDATVPDPKQTPTGSRAKYGIKVVG
ncbi:MAG: cytochrome c maturation protein CcmE [Fimbriimonadaceae bacterium]|nr:cytochrome c maturation protein CcmE [Fimbriimonadaceae bacterium]